MDKKQRRLIRKWKKQHPKEVADGITREEIWGIISKTEPRAKSLKLLEKKKVLENDENIRYNIYRNNFREGETRCFVCNSIIKNPHKSDWIKSPGDGYYFYHVRKCGAHTRIWVMNHPTLLSLLVYLEGQGELTKDKGGEIFREYREWRKDPNLHLEEEVSEFLKWYENKKSIEEEHTMSKKNEKESKTEEKKTGRGSGLVPKEPVQVPKELYKNKTIGPILTKMRDTDDPDEKRICRAELRKAGFKLSDESTWKPFLKGGKKEEEEDDDEEEEKGKKGKKSKKEEKKSSKKKMKEEEEDDDDDDDDDDDE